MQTTGKSTYLGEFCILLQKSHQKFCSLYKVLFVLMDFSIYIIYSFYILRLCVLLYEIFKEGTRVKKTNMS